MEQLDKLGRATWRHIPYQAVTSTTERENQWLRFLNTHGPVNARFLHRLTAAERKCEQTTGRQLRKLRAGNLIRYDKAQRRHAIAPWNNYYVYQITKAGKSWLKDIGQFEETRVPTGHWLHGYMTSCVTASIDIMARRKGHHYVPGHKILELRDAPLAIPVDGQRVIPDQLFAIDYGGTYRAFALEVDRGTEQKSVGGRRKSYASSIDDYLKIIERKLHSAHYGLKASFGVLFVFARQSDQRAFLAILESRRETCPFILTQTVSNFDGTYAPPEVFEHLYSQPWDRVGMQPLHIDR